MADAFVLVVDDNPDTLDLVAKTLELEGIRVRKAGSVFRALESMHDGSPPPSLIITDLLMPQTTGWDFVKHLRGEPALKTIPIMVMTGAEPGESGSLANVVMQKPLDTDKMVEQVRALLNSGAA